MTAPRPGKGKAADKLAAPSQMIPIAEIGELKAEDYVGLIDSAAIDALKASLEAEGLHTPIWLRKNGNAWKGAPYSVIAGRHRLAAARELGWAEIAAEVRAGPDSKSGQLKQLQLIENLDRRVPRPIERACLIMERWSAVASTIEPTEPGSQQAAAIRKRWSASDTMSDTQRGERRGVWAAAAHTPEAGRREVDKRASAVCAMSERNVRTYRNIHSKIVIELPDLFVQLNAHPLGENLSDMTTLAQVKMPNTRRKAALAILSRDDWPNAQAALVSAGIVDSTGNRAKPEAKFQAIWSGMSPLQKRSHFVSMARDIPHSFVRQVIDELRTLLP